MAATGFMGKVVCLLVQESMKSEGQTGLEGETVPLGYITIGVELPPHFVGVSGLSGERMNDCGFGLKCTRTGLNG